MAALTIDEIRQGHKLLAEFVYETRPVERGYANRTLYVDLSTNTIRSKPVTQEMKDIFTGGKGFCMWLLWNAIQPTTRWDDPENEIIIAGGPIGGITAYPGSGKSTVATVSPLTGSVIDSNSGGYFGPYLKFAGWDALEVQGIAERDVILVIDGDEGRVTLEEAPLEDIDTHLIGRQLTEMYARDERDMRSVSVVSTGQGAAHSRYAGLNLSWYDVRRKEVRVKQAGRGGAGRVFRHKGLKAIVVRYSQMKGDSNNPANMELIRRAGTRINREIAELDSKQNNMRKVGTGHLPPIMNEFDLLPVNNYRYGSHPDAQNFDTPVWERLYTQGIPDGCWYGCTLSCAHGVDHFHLRTGPYKGHKVVVDGPEYETAAGAANMGCFDAEFLAEYNFYCDTYGIDTISFATTVAFVMEPSRTASSRPSTPAARSCASAPPSDPRAAARDGPRRGLRRRRGQGRALAQGQVGPRVRRRPAGSCRTSAWRSRASSSRSTSPRSRWPSRPATPWPQGPAARRGLADLHGHGQQPTPVLRGQGRGALLLPALPHLVRPDGPVQADLERRRARRQQGDRGAEQGAGARRELHVAVRRTVIPTLKKVRELGIDFPEVVALLAAHGVTE
jgi:aldehyde:ferredoxin oxidoreductase